MSEDENPLEELYEDKDEVDQKRLAQLLKGIIGIDRESGEPIFHEGYQRLSNKEMFVAQLLYRRAAVALGELEEEEQGGSHEDFAENLDVSGSAVRNYASDLSFVDSNEGKGGYVVSNYAVEKAIDFVERGKE